MSQIAACTAEETRMAEETFQRRAGDLEMIADRHIAVQSVAVERVRQRAVGAGTVHISFKLGFQQHGRIAHGALLVPLADAITLGCYLLMVSDDAVKSRRGSATL